MATPTRDAMLTEQQIEERVSRYVDHIDRVFLAGQIDQKTYDGAMRDLHEWAESKYREREVYARARLRRMME